jgi:hypothetical protein
MTPVTVEAVGDERRAAVMTGLLVAAVVLVLGLGSGIGAVLHRSSASKSPTHSATAAAAGDAPLAGSADGTSAGGIAGSVSVGTLHNAHLASSSTAAGGDAGMSSAAAGAPASSTGAAAASGAAACDAAPMAAGVLDPFVVHLDHAHLETSPGQQVTDILNIDQYVKTHTVLVENMFLPVFKLLLTTPSDVDPFIVHLDHAHLETSPGQQVSDALNVSQYVKTHTVLVENMVAPSLAVVDGTC